MYVSHQRKILLGSVMCGPNCSTQTQGAVKTFYCQNLRRWMMAGGTGDMWARGLTASRTERVISRWEWSSGWPDRKMSREWRWRVSMQTGSWWLERAGWQVRVNLEHRRNNVSTKIVTRNKAECRVGLRACSTTKVREWCGKDWGERRGPYTAVADEMMACRCDSRRNSGAGRIVWCIFWYLGMSIGGCL